MNNENNDTLVSGSINLLRFPLTIAVIMLHCRFSLWSQPELYNKFNGEFYLLFSRLVSGNICRIAVPMFFAISGYLFFLNFSHTKVGYISKLQRRTKTIIVPFLLWNLIYIIIYVIMRIQPVVDEFNVPRGIVPWINGGGVVRVLQGTYVNYNASSAPINIPLWYLRDLIVMFIISPFVYLWSFSRKYGFILLVIFWIIFGNYQFPSFVPIRSQVLFFWIGAYWAVQKVDIINWSDKIPFIKLFALYIIMVMTAMLTDDNLNGYFNRIAVLFGMIVVFKVIIYAIRKKVKLIPIVQSVWDNSFFLYATHWLLLVVISHPLYTLSVIIGLPASFIYLIQLPICIITLVPIGLFLKTRFPRVMKALNGR